MAVTRPPRADSDASALDSIAARLRYRRETLGLTSVAVAIRAGYAFTPDEYRRWESGAHRPYKHLAALASALECSAAWIDPDAAQRKRRTAPRAKPRKDQ